MTAHPTYSGCGLQPDRHGKMFESVEMCDLTISVFTGLGIALVTRMCSSSSSSFRHSCSMYEAAFDTQYAAAPLRGFFAEFEPTKRTRPPPARFWIREVVRMNCASRLVLITRRQHSIPVSWTRLMGDIPAACTKNFTRELMPMASMIALQPTSELTSALRHLISPGAFSAVSSSADLRRPTANIVKDSLLNSMAVARPMPEPAPVTMANVPDSMYEPIFPR